MAAHIKVGRGGAGNFYGEADLKQLRSASSSGKDQDLEAQHASPSASTHDARTHTHPNAPPPPEYMHSGRGGAGNWYSPREEGSTPTSTLPSSSTVSSTTPNAGPSVAALINDSNDTEEKRSHGRTGGGRGGAGNIEFGRLMAERSEKDRERGTELREWRDGDDDDDDREQEESRLRERVERDVEMGLPVPQKAFLGPGR